MNLIRVDINNFRSIANIELKFSPKCRILVGINESGKSNIIKALSTLSGEDNLQASDVRQPLPDEPIISEAFVRFVFEFAKDEIELICDEINSKILTSNVQLPIIKNNNGDKFTLKQFIQKEKRQKLFKSDLLSKKKNILSWKINSYNVLPGWKKVSPQCPDAYEVTIEDGRKIQLKKNVLVHENYFTTISKEYLADITFDEINSMIDKFTEQAFNDLKPETICWDYSEKNLLPAQIDINQFITNPNICLPLKQMFELAGITDIKKTIEDAKTTSTFGIRNCLNRVADLTTQHFRNVWKEYKTITFQLSMNGNFIDAAIKDEFNHFEFTKRSDGFKRFVTFLLLVSARVKTNQLSDALLLIDEPDICLHPSGARYLRDELIKISHNNYVVYSTHSIFMIDKEQIERHLIVKKTDEKTAVIAADSSNVVDEEVIYNALGYSIFESLNKKNILFEGWKDKKLCEEALKKLPKEYKHLKSSFEDVGLCHAKGVKDIQNITPLLELANRACLILSDDDKPAKEKQKEFNKTKGYGVWLRYSELDGSIDAVTGEDFVKSDFIVSCINKLKIKSPILAGFTVADLAISKDKIHTIKMWLKSKGLNDDAQKEIIDALKDNVFANLKASQIESSYYFFLEKISEKLRV